MTEAIRILYVDDYPQDRALVRDALEESGGFHLTLADSRESFEEALGQRDYDLVLSDFNILGFTGLDVIDAVQASNPDVPVVIVTGTGSEETAVRAMRRGAADYVIKSPAHIRRLPHTIRAVLETERLREEEEAAQRALRQAYEEGLQKQEALLSLTEDLRDEIRERRRAQAETRRLVHELQLLSRSATELISLPIERDIYEYIGETLTVLLDDAVIIINKHAPASDAMEIVGVYGLGTSLLQRAVALLDRSPVGQTYPMLPEAQRLFETGDLEIFPGGFTRLGEGFAPSVVLQKLEALLSIKRTYLIGLTVGDDFYAGVQIYTRHEPAIEHPDLIQTFIRQASIALQQRRAEKALEVRVAQLDLLNEMGREITSELNLDAVLRRATDLVQETFGYYQVVVLTMEEDRRTLVLQAKAGGFADVIPDGYRQRTDEGLIGWAASHGEPALVNDVDGDPRYVNRHPDRIHTKSELSMPIMWRGDVLGVLDLQSDHRHAFDESDVSIMRTVADQMAVAMNNARLYEAERAARRQLADLAGYLQEAREGERTRIARVIHDELGQMMTVLKMDLASLAKRLPEDEPPLMERVEGMSEVVDESLRFVRRIARRLRPGILDDLGLAAAIEWQATAFCERSDMDCRLDLDEAADKLDRKASTALFRILQEGLTNVVRHAQASEVRIELRVEPDEVVLTLADDGRGISPEERSRPESLGLLGMRERARGLGGELRVEGEPGQGTTLTARVPRSKT